MFSRTYKNAARRRDVLREDFKKALDGEAEKMYDTIIQNKNFV